MSKNKKAHGKSELYHSVHAKALTEYGEQVKKYDDRTLVWFQKTDTQFDFIYRLNIVFSILIFVVVMGLLGCSLWLILSNHFVGPGTSIGIGGFLVGLLALFFGLYLGPQRKIHISMSRLTKMNIIFLGFIRQLNQIDIAYKQTILSVDSVDLQETLKAIYNIQEIVEQSVDEIVMSFEDTGVF